MPRPQYPLALVSTALLIAAASGSTIPALAAPGIAFGVPVVVDPIHTNGEPDIGIDPQGRVFVSGPTGTGTQRSTWFGSVDQGHTFRVISPGPPPSAIAEAAGVGAVTGYSPFGADGYPQIDQTTGKVFQAAGTQNPDGTFSLLLNIGTPNAAGDLTFLDNPTAANPNGDPSKLIHIADHLPFSPDTLFSVLSIDTGRNLFAAWTVGGNGSSVPTSARQTYVSSASAASGWGTWSPAVRVSDASTSTGDAVNVFPWIKAGGPRRADAVWYGQKLNVDPSSQSRQSWNVLIAPGVYPT